MVNKPCRFSNTEDLGPSLCLGSFFSAFLALLLLFYILIASENSNRVRNNFFNIPSLRKTITEGPHALGHLRSIV
jgi:hypothetical protein